MNLAELVRYLDEYLTVRDIPDSDGALNGLQVEGPDEVASIAVTVDASEASIRAAVDAGADLLIVHHGMFWDGNRAATGARYRRLKLLLDNDLALYSVHLPLDVHAEVGNNALLARKLGVRIRGRFGSHLGIPIGVYGDLEISLDGLRDRLASTVDAPARVIAGGPDPVGSIGVVTGSGASALADAAALGLDALVTGEAKHHDFFEAMEGGVSLLLGGHYATETFGVRALGSHLEERFSIPWTYLHLPTGM
ncbi:MAG TPA: Nif3-like dinuclear metal center hexameric protein [Longimicrobiales bacterium]|nr:Nif3-like dinuclear metal center hexameric protein [Longimicrobiales bacterium]